MRGQGLRSLLDDIQRVVGEIGNKGQAEALGKLSESLKVFDQQLASEITETIEQCLQHSTAPRRVVHLRSLITAGLIEDKFVQAFVQLECDKSLKRADLLWIATEFKARAPSSASGPKILQAIKGAFYERLYDRDADTMAKRATPW